MDQNNEGAEYWDMVCPKCGEHKVKKYLYGLVEDPSKLDRRYVLGGCVIDGKNPNWHCEACQHDWRAVDSNQAE